MAWSHEISFPKILRNGIGISQHAKFLGIFRKILYFAKCIFGRNFVFCEMHFLGKVLRNFRPKFRCPKLHGSQKIFQKYRLL